MQAERGDRAADVNFYTEVVEIGMRDGSVRRAIAEGLFDELEMKNDDGGATSFVLKRYDR